MRPAECAYWDKESTNNRDNVWKRKVIAHKILEHEWVNHRVLEIGVGMATIAAALKVIHIGNMKYIGTDVSANYCKKAIESFALNVVQADVLSLPKVDGGFTRVIALDSLEHVRPEDREEGYKAIGERMSDDALMLINMPLNVSYHEPEFDHPFDFEDITALCNLADLEMTKYEKYGVDVPDGRLYYGWVELRRCKV